MRSKPMTFQTLKLPGATLHLDNDFLSSDRARALQTRLHRSLPWRQRQVKIGGTSFNEPRLTAWHGEAYSYSGNSLDPEPLTPDLDELRLLVQTALGNAGIAAAPFNSVLANLYRAGHRDSIGMHADDEAELGFEPVIASLSFGRPAQLRLAPKPGRQGKPARILLRAGSLFVMARQTQANWKHGIDKDARPPTEDRINLTFRTIFPGTSGT